MVSIGILMDLFDWDMANVFWYLVYLGCCRCCNFGKIMISYNNGYIILIHVFFGRRSRFSTVFLMLFLKIYGLPCAFDVEIGWFNQWRLASSNHGIGARDTRDWSHNGASEAYYFHHFPMPRRMPWVGDSKTRDLLSGHVSQKNEA